MRTATKVRLTYSTKINVGFAVDLIAFEMFYNYEETSPANSFVRLQKIKKYLPETLLP